MSILSNYSQADDTPTGTIRGLIINQQTHQPIINANVSIPDIKQFRRTNHEGEFRFDQVKPGRYKILVSFIGFESYSENIVHTSGKELILNIEMIESFVKSEEVIVKAYNSQESINESAIVSSMVFTIDDVQRFAGSRMDVARMAQNYAGISNINDRRNDLIIRGGSPTELLWRLDGLDILNPNHFGTQGATGGPVNAINQYLLDNSDFITGALPANYLDKMSGVFDLRTKQGNDEKYEFLVEAGFSGFQVGAQGPITGKNSTFAINYRYSFLDFLELLGKDFGFTGIPQYQDATFRTDFKFNKNNKLFLTGLYGKSDIFIDKTELADVYTGDKNIKNGNNLLTLGLNWQHLFSNNLYGNLILGYVSNDFRTNLDSITTDENSDIESLTPWYQNLSNESYVNCKYEINYSPNSRENFSFGIEGRYRYFHLFEERFSSEPDSRKIWKLDEKGNTMQYFSYLIWNYHITSNIKASLGVASQYFAMNEKITIEPRAGLRWNFLPLQSLNFGFGIHRQSLPLVLYYHGEENRNLESMQSIHYIAGYNYSFSEDALLKIEGYYKDISKAAIEKYDSTSFSFLNAGSNFGSVGGWGTNLISSGKGNTYGIELSIIKNYSKGYYITATGSYVRQQYSGSDNIKRFGGFDNIFICNLLSGYELILTPSNSLEFSIKYTIAGGTPYTPIDMEKSSMFNRTYYLESEAFTLRNPNYQRFDIRIDLRNHFRSLSLIVFASVENLFNNMNILTYEYDPKNDDVRTIYQLGRLFVGGIRVEF